MDGVAVGWAVGSTIISAAFAAGGAYWATRVEIRHLWKDQGRQDKAIERAHERIDQSFRDSGVV